MKITDFFRPFFTANAISEGKRYFQLKMIYLLEAWKGEARGLVYGSSEYRVLLRSQKLNQLSASCDCPSLKVGGSACGHIWATLKKAEETEFSKNFLGPLSAIQLNLFYDDEHRFQVSERQVYLDTNDFPREFEESQKITQPPNNWTFPKLWEDDESDNDVFSEADAGYLKARQKMLNLPGSLGDKLFKLFQDGTLKTAAPSWDQLLSSINRSLHQRIPNDPDNQQKIIYQIDVSQSKRLGQLILLFYLSKKKQNGEWGKRKALTLKRDLLRRWTNPQDRDIIALMFGAKRHEEWEYRYGRDYDSYGSAFNVPDGLTRQVLQKICDTERAELKPSRTGEALQALQWDEAGPWTFSLKVEKNQKVYIVSGYFTRANERLSMEAPHMLLMGGYIFWENKVGLLEDHGAFDWISILREQKQIKVPLVDGNRFIKKLYAMPVTPPVLLPKELRLKEVRIKPNKNLILKSEESYYNSRAIIKAHPYLNYDGEDVSIFRPGAFVFIEAPRKLIHRDSSSESLAKQELFDLGFKKIPKSLDEDEEDALTIPVKKMNQAVLKLIQSNWKVEADGKIYRRAKLSLYPWQPASIGSS